MKPAAKRVIAKGSILSVAVNGFVVFSQYHEHGFVSHEVWSKIALSLAMSMLFIVGMGLLLNGLVKEPQPDGPAEKRRR